MPAERIVRLSVPAEADFARTVRMMAASLAVECDMNMDEVEDVRMAAEEGFVYCCATAPQTCEVSFALSAGQVRTSFVLGPEEAPAQDAALDLAELLLSAVCDEHGVSEDGTTLDLLKRAGAVYGE